MTIDALDPVESLLADASNLVFDYVHDGETDKQAKARLREVEHLDAAIDAALREVQRLIERHKQLDQQLAE